MACDAKNRYHHLLQPIRDLSKVWNIEIAEELEKYLDEVSSLTFETDGDGKQLNFAEAALLIQGSAAVYSRKVELLYSLVYQVLTTCQNTEKECSGNDQVRRRLHTGLVAPIPETEELLTIDHLIKEGRNITLEEPALRRHEQRQFAHLRLPLFLMPREKTEGRQEFHIGNCCVHSSGAYLIQESDAHLLDGFLSCEDSCDVRTPLVPPPPKEVRDLDERLQELLHGLQADETELQASPAVEQPPAVVQPTDAAEFSEVPVADDSLAPPESLFQPLVPFNDNDPGGPWELLDEHMQVGQDTRAEVSGCTKRMGNKRLLAKADVLPEPGDWEPLSDTERWRPGGAMAGSAELLSCGHPVHSRVFAVGRHLRNGNRSEVQKSGFSAAWLEFEDLFEAVAKKRQHGKLGKGNGPIAHDAPPCTPCAAYSDDDAEAWTPKRSTLKPSQDTPLKNEGHAHLQDQQRLEVAKIEGLIEDAHSQYETSIRDRLHHIQGNEGIFNEKYPELYENVRKWQQQLKPVLKEFESRPEFNMGSYRDKLLSKMVVMERERAESEEDSSIPFSRLVHGQPHWEVCRRFLTCLTLTNQGNTDIVLEGKENRLNAFSLRLLKESETNDPMQEDPSARSAERKLKRAKVSHSR